MHRVVTISRFWLWVVYYRAMLGALQGANMHFEKGEWIYGKAEALIAIGFGAAAFYHLFGFIRYHVVRLWRRAQNA